MSETQSTGEPKLIVPLKDSPSTIPLIPASPAVRSSSEPINTNESTIERLARIKATIAQKIRKITTEPVEPPLTATELLRLAGMTDQKAYYSGLPATEEEIGADRLMTIFSRLEARHGKGAAMDFARMTYDMPSLAPVHFIDALQALQHNNWVYDPQGEEEPKNGNSTALTKHNNPPTNSRPIALSDKDPNHRAANAFFSVAALSQDIPDETAAIKQNFADRLKNENGIDITAPKTIIEGNK